MLVERAKVGEVEKLLVASAVLVDRDCACSVVSVASGWGALVYEGAGMRETSAKGRGDVLKVEMAQRVVAGWRSEYCSSSPRVAGEMRL